MSRLDALVLRDVKLCGVIRYASGPFLQQMYQVLNMKAHIKQPTLKGWEPTFSTDIVAETVP